MMKILGHICMSLWHGDDVVAYTISRVVWLSLRATTA